MDRSVYTRRPCPLAGIEGDDIHPESPGKPAWIASPL